jgi:uncharacterized membrane protein
VENKFKKYIIYTIVIVVTLFITSLILDFFLKLGFFNSFRIVFGTVYVLFLPGFIISFIFFPETKPYDNKTKNSVDVIERIALSFALSIAVVPLAVFYLNLIGLKINLFNSFFTILAIILVSVIVLIIRLKYSQFW